MDSLLQPVIKLPSACGNESILNSNRDPCILLLLYYIHYMVLRILLQLYLDFYPFVYMVSRTQTNQMLDVICTFP